MAQATELHTTSRFHNLSDAALADALGNADAVLKRAEANCKSLIAATRAANAGATVAQLEAIFGWSGGRMASLYTRSADRRRLAMEAMHKLRGNDR
jgi:hypothetical protein